MEISCFICSYELLWQGIGDWVMKLIFFLSVGFTLLWIAMKWQKTHHPPIAISHQIFILSISVGYEASSLLKLKWKTIVNTFEDHVKKSPNGHFPLRTRNYSSQDTRIWWRLFPLLLLFNANFSSNPFHQTFLKFQQPWCYITIISLYLLFILSLVLKLWLVFD